MEDDDPEVPNPLLLGTASADPPLSATKARQLGPGTVSRDCPFCDLSTRQLLGENRLAAAFWDDFPVSRGHTLIVPRRHVAGWFDATGDERLALLDLAEQVKVQLDASLRPDGYNLGLNCGRAAGQTVMHLHIHLIPRYTGDQNDPRGGVRKIFPRLASYWERTE